MRKPCQKIKLRLPGRKIGPLALLAVAVAMTGGAALAQEVNGLSALRGTTNETGTDETATATVSPAKSLDRTAQDALDAASFRRITDDSLDAGRQNLRQSPLDERRSQPPADDGLGIRIGTMVLKPEVSQGLGVKRETDGGEKTSTTYWNNGLKGTLTSDWSQHELKITGDGTWRRKIAGDGDDDPSGKVDAQLRLDLNDDMAARLSAGYGFSRESTTDPNAVRNASVQSGVHQFSTGAVLERETGRLRGSVGVNFDRFVYTDAKLSDGSTLSNSDRNRNTITLNSRLGYEISPALLPFVEILAGRSNYDQSRDSAGYARSGNLYGAKAGIASDMGEKLKGELALGYERASFEDSRLSDLGAMTVDGSVLWSPRRGTNVDLGLKTSIEPSTTAGVSGDVAYALTALVTHELRDNLVARLSGGTTWRNYRGAGDNSTAYSAGAGLTYTLNRNVDLTADVTYELSSGTSTDRTLTAGIGVKLKR
ncbi:outer membrane beta-barrel protein [Allorhizobium undicola]|uniref:outer membrane beta-barrel protein n=1 Tax=Allorhizobium undicola TaxID=78527 RepID=UPI003D3354B8